MSDYTQTIDFSAKDSLLSGDPNKLIKGVDFDTEFAGIAAAIATKFDTSDIASQETAEAGASNTTLLTPLRASQWALAGFGFADPNEDAVFFWDDSEGEVVLGELPDSALSSNVPRKNAANTFTSTQTISRTGGNALLTFETSDASTNEKLWSSRVVNSGTQLQLGTRDDGGSWGASFLNVTRSGTTVSTVAISGSTITLNGVDVTNYARLSQSNTFTGGTQKVQVSSGSVQHELRTTDAAGQAEQKLTTTAGSWSLFMGAASSTLSFFDGTATRFSIANGGNYDFKAGTVTTSNASAAEVGFKGVPRTSKTADYTITAADAGTELVLSSAADDITVQASGQPPAGSVVFLENNTGGSVDIIQGSGMTLTLDGTSTTGSRTLAPNGRAYIRFTGSGTARVGGPGVA